MEIYNGHKYYKEFIRFLKENLIYRRFFVNVSYIGTNYYDGDICWNFHDYLYYGNIFGEYEEDNFNENCDKYMEYAFLWENSEEGNDFWYDYNNKWMGILTELRKKDKEKDDNDKRRSFRESIKTFFRKANFFKKRVD